MNTLLVMNLIFVFFREGYAAANDVAVSAVYGFILTIIGINGVPEAIVAGILTLCIGKVLLKKNIRERLGFKNDLAIDIGNTNIVVGCIDGSDCVFVERISTVRTKTELEYAIDIKNVLDIYHIKKAELEGGIISSLCLRSLLWSSWRLRRF